MLMKTAEKDEPQNCPLSFTLHGEGKEETAQGSLIMQPGDSEQVKWLYFVKDVAMYKCRIRYLICAENMFHVIVQPNVSFLSSG